MLTAQNIQLFQNLSQFDFGGGYIDFHNDFNCIRLKFERSVLVLVFVSITNEVHLSMKFHNVSVAFIDLDFIEKSESVTIDSLYRGRFEIDNRLIEFENERGYFYLEFYEGQRIEFWCESVSVEKIGV